MNPGESDKEYVQWQRGPISRIDINQMKGWVDTVMNHDNNWLVLVFHGIENLGWEPKTRLELVEYFSYMKANEEKLWIATFRDITKYLRERKATEVKTEISTDAIIIELTSDLDPEMYQVPLTFKTYIPTTWSSVQVTQEDETAQPEIQQDEDGSYIIYNLTPGKGSAKIEKRA